MHPYEYLLTKGHSLILMLVDPVTLDFQLRPFIGSEYAMVNDDGVVDAANLIQAKLKEARAFDSSWWDNQVFNDWVVHFMTLPKARVLIEQAKKGIKRHGLDALLDKYLDFGNFYSIHAVLILLDRYKGSDFAHVSDSFLEGYLNALIYEAEH